MASLSDKSLSDKVSSASSSGPPDLSDADSGIVVNRVADSAIETFDLESLWGGGEIVEFDIAPFLFQGLIVKEREFRASVKAQDWSAFTGKHVAIFSSVDTIIPTWAYMLIASRLDSFASSVSLGRSDDLSSSYYTARLAEFDFSKYKDRIVVVKGCGSGIVPVSAYVDATQRLQKVAKKLMFGEACSSVPLWRKS